MLGSRHDHFASVFDQLRIQIQIGCFVEGVSRSFRNLDALAKCDRPFHRMRIGFSDEPFIAQNLLRHGIDATDEFGSIIRTDFVVFVGNHTLHRRRHILLAHRQNQYFVIRQQVLFHCLAKADSVNFLSVKSRVVHRTNNRIIFSRLRLRIFVVQPRCSRHVKPFSGFQNLVVVDFRKGRFIFL